MAQQVTLDSFEQYLGFFHKMYDAVRIINPIDKQVLEYRDKNFSNTSEICYEYWKNDQICDNCISIRAHRDNKSYIKLEQRPDVIIMVTALPVEAFGEPVVLELFKNATDSILVGTGKYEVGHPMHRVVAEMNDMVSKDALTSVYNRRYISDRLPADIVRATLSHSPLTLIFLDIDNLKQINDNYGHSAGDLVLKQIAETIRDCIRGEDWTARYGGDEFLICLNNIRSPKAYQVAKRIKTAIGGISLPYEEDRISLTVSMGMHTMEDAPLTPDELILLADKNMYKAKKSGKDLIVASELPENGSR